MSVHQKPIDYVATVATTVAAYLHRVDPVPTEASAIYTASPVPLYLRPRPSEWNGAVGHYLGRAELPNGDPTAQLVVLEVRSEDNMSLYTRRQLPVLLTVDQRALRWHHCQPRQP